MCGEGRCDELSEETVDARKKEGAGIAEDQQERGTQVPHTITLHGEIKENINIKSWLLRNCEVVIMAEVALSTSISACNIEKLGSGAWE